MSASSRSTSISNCSCCSCHGQNRSGKIRGAQLEPLYPQSPRIVVRLLALRRGIWPFDPDQEKGQQKSPIMQGSDTFPYYS